MTYPIIHQVICKRTFNYMYYKNLPSTFKKTEDFIIKEIPFSKIKLKKSILENSKIVKDKFQ